MGGLTQSRQCVRTHTGITLQHHHAAPRTYLTPDSVSMCFDHITKRGAYFFALKEGIEAGWQMTQPC